MQTKSSIIVSIIITAIIVGGGAFYGGMKYDQNKGGVSLSNLQNMSPEQRQQAFGQFRNSANLSGLAAGGRGANGGQGGGGGFVMGDIIGKDDPEGEQALYGASKSITIKLPDGGSRIIFLSGSTEITKSTAGSDSDLQMGQQITVNGTSNQDGSVIAKSIQISPVAR